MDFNEMNIGHYTATTVIINRIIQPHRKKVKKRKEKTTKIYKK